jgi:pimeloyl-ACP methyl ester carboxylesterase
MNQQEPQFIDIGVGGRRRRIAYRFEPGKSGTSPAIVWLSGFMSDMASTKVGALSDWARSQGYAMLRFDYSGHGESEGSLLETTVGGWLEESAAMLSILGDRRFVLVGSSLGGWIALLLARTLAQSDDKRLGGLVLIAPAWDMTETLMWDKMSEKSRAKVVDEGVFHAPSDYEDPYPITRILIEEGRDHLLAEGNIDVGVPVRILQGLRDTDVPWQHALALVELLATDDVEITLIKDGDHRLSGPEDLRRLERAVGLFLQGLRSLPA